MIDATPFYTTDETQIMGLYSKYANLKRLIDQHTGEEGSLYHEYHINCQKLAEQISNFKPTSLICCQIQLDFASSWHQDNTPTTPDAGNKALFTAVTQLRNLTQLNPIGA